MAFQLLQNMASGHVKVKKGTSHVFYMATPRHASESVEHYPINRVGDTTVEITELRTVFHEHYSLPGIISD